MTSDRCLFTWLDSRHFSTIFVVAINLSVTVYVSVLLSYCILIVASVATVICSGIYIFVEFGRFLLFTFDRPLLWLVSSCAIFSRHLPRVWYFGCPPLPPRMSGHNSSKPRTWSLSQETNKDSGTCSICFAKRKLHLKDGTVQTYGPRSSPCPGPHELPLESSGNASPDIAIRSQSAYTTSRVESGQPALNWLMRSAARMHLVSWCQHPTCTVKHIPWEARVHCANELTAAINSALFKSDRPERKAETQRNRSASETFYEGLHNVSVWQNISSKVWSRHCTESRNYQ